jgi:hypothetical protein
MIFSFMFLIHMPPSMWEAAGAGTHEMAAAMVKAADALWDARGSHDPTVAAVLTQRSRSPAPNNGKRGDKWSGNAPSKSHPPPALTSIPFSTLAMAYVNFTFITPIRLTGVLHPVLGRKLACRRTTFDSVASSTCWNIVTFQKILKISQFFLFLPQN